MLEKIDVAKQSIKNIVIGQDQVVDLLFTALLANGHILLESYPGLGKTKLAKSFAKVINGDFRRIQFTPDVLPSDITGIQFLNPKTHEFELRMGPIKTNILLADEINRATPRTQSSLLEAMEEQQITIDGITINIPSPFLVVATQNPIESNQGTFPLPEAQLDRFLMKINLDFPMPEQELEVLNVYQSDDPFHHIIPVLSIQEVVELQKKVTFVEVSKVVKNYLMAIIWGTRQHPEVEMGASTRAALSLMRVGQAYAFLQGRKFVTPQDIKELAPFVLEHRIILTLDGMMRKTNHEVILEVIEQQQVPVEMEFGK